MTGTSPRAAALIEGTPPIPSPAPASEAVASPSEVLSPSQIRCFMDCQIRWWFKYGRKVPDAPTGNMALGRAVHSALCEKLCPRKVEHSRGSSRTWCCGIISGGLGQRAAKTPNSAMMKIPSNWRLQEKHFVTKYMDYLAPTIDPAAVELRGRRRNRGRQSAGLD